MLQGYLLEGPIHRCEIHQLHRLKEGQPFELLLESDPHCGMEGMTGINSDIDIRTVDASPVAREPNKKITRAGSSDRSVSANSVALFRTRINH